MAVKRKNNLVKKIFTAAVALLIVALVAGIIYVLMVHEEPSVITEPKKETKHITKKVVQPKPEGEKEKALPVKPPPAREVAIIVDDLGNDLNAARELLKIKADLTFAVLPLQRNSREAAEMFHKAKKEILLHLPMEPVSYPDEKPGEGALFTDMSDEEILFQLQKDLAAVPYISGVNNHMGSKFMTDEKKLSLIFNELKKKKLFFVDSRTSADTKTSVAAKKTGLPVAERKVFIDNNRDYNKVYAILLNVAKSDNVPAQIIIGHPHPETIKAIRDSVKVFREHGIAIVPVSHVLNK